MKTLQEIKHFYESGLREELERMEKMRKIIWLVFIFINIVLLYVAVMLFFSVNRIVEDIFGSFLAASVVYIFSVAAIHNILSRGYKAQFYNKIFSKVIRFMDGSLTYSRNDHIPEALYNKSRIFKRKQRFYKGKGYVSGKIDKTDLISSYIKTKRNSIKTEIIIFEGFFYVGNLEKIVPSRTALIFKKDIEEDYIVGPLGKILPALMKIREPAIRTNSPELDEIFVTRSNDAAKAMSLLQNSLIQQIIDYQKKSDKCFFLSFIGTQVFFAVRYYTPVFEHGLSQSILDFEPNKDYFEDMVFFMDVIKNINSNTKI
jgi:hypothetical protein